MMTTVRDLAANVKTILDEVTVLQANISSSVNAYKTCSTSGPQSTKFQSEIRDLKSDADKYDTEFREHERLLQATGGKPRHQTLQEFVFLFFYTGFTVLGISLAMLSYTKTRSWTNVLKIVGLMIFIGLLTTAIIIRYA
jgi:hypothetical protein